MDLPIELSQTFGWPASEPRRCENACWSLVQAAQSGSQEAFRQLVERHQDIIYDFCTRWLGNAEDAREVCQDTFVRAWEALPRFQKRARFSTWLYRIALNLCRDRYKSKAGRQNRATLSIEDTPREWACPQPLPDESASQSGDLEKLQRGIQALPESLRSPLLLCCIEGLSQQECAHILKCSSRAVEGRIYRARRALLDWWNREL
jgi:RNA polymerase sigma-70 factor, ECF subfamily